MRLLIDQNLPFLSAPLLRGLGHDAVHAGELGLQRASDQYLLELAEVENRVIATHDIDFPTLIATAKLSRPSVVLLRERGLLPEDVCERIHQACSTFEARLKAGCLVTISATSVRARDLPLWSQR